MKSYRCKVEYDNGAVVKILHVIVFAENEYKASHALEDHLCKHHDESIRSASITQIDINEGDAFVLGGI